MAGGGQGGYGRRPSGRGGGRYGYGGGNNGSVGAGGAVIYAQFSNFGKSRLARRWKLWYYANYS